MFPLYVLVLIALALAHAAVRWRVRSLERRYIRIAAEAETLVKASGYRGGNGLPDPLLAARRQYDLACAAVRRERVEARYLAWQAFAERFARLRGWLSGYRGTVLPYAGGAADVAAVLVALDRLGPGLGVVRAWLNV